MLICLNIEINLASSCPGSPTRSCSQPELYFHVAPCRPMIDFGETYCRRHHGADTVLSSHTLLPRHGVPRASIPSMRSGTSEGEMGQEAEDVPVVYLHEIKRQYTQGDEHRSSS